MQTIVACATPWGRSAVAMIRLSGPEALQVARAVCPGGPQWRPRRLVLRRALDGERLVDEVLAVWMPGPASYTGEDVVELSGHGNPVLVEALLELCVRAGARPARAGEFTRRALVSGRTDVLRAEALAALIEARSIEGARVAQQALEGSLGESLSTLREELLDLAAELEARLDHPDDDLSLATDDEVGAALEGVAERTGLLAATWRAGRLAIQGARVALVGPVNAGKSSLFNHLVGQRRALVSDEPGTTRDVVEGTVVVAGRQLTLLDTAGRREATGLEAQGQALAAELIADADLVVQVYRLDEPAPDGELVVGTHADLVDPEGRLAVDNTTGEGVEQVRAEILRRVSGDVAGQRAVVLSQRQHDLLASCSRHAARAAAALWGPDGPAVAAEEVTLALERLGELEGRDVREDVLDRLFSRFCVGK